MMCHYLPVVSILRVRLEELAVPRSERVIQEAAAVAEQQDRDRQRQAQHHKDNGHGDQRQVALVLGADGRVRVHTHSKASKVKQQITREQSKQKNGRTLNSGWPVLNRPLIARCRLADTAGTVAPWTKSASPETQTHARSADVRTTISAPSISKRNLSVAEEHESSHGSNVGVHRQRWPWKMWCLETAAEHSCTQRVQAALRAMRSSSKSSSLLSMKVRQMQQVSKPKLHEEYDRRHGAQEQQLVPEQESNRNVETMTESPHKTHSVR
jgi:hypothetical protein